MPRNITVTFEDGSTHVYQNAPDDITPEQASARALQDFGKMPTHLDGGRGESISGAPTTVDEIAHSMGQAAPANSPSVSEGLGHSLIEGIPIVGALYDKGIAAALAAQTAVAGYMGGQDAPTNAEYGQRADASFSENYRHALAAQKGMNEQFSQSHPYLSAGGNIVGGLASGVASAPIGAPASIARMSGVLGTIARAGLSTAENGVVGGMDNRLRDGSFGQGAVTGAALGLGAHALRSVGGTDFMSQIARALGGVGLGAGVGAAGATVSGADPLAAAVMGGAAAAGGEAVGAAANTASSASRVFNHEAGANAGDRAFNAREVAARKVAQALASEGTTREALSARMAELGPRATLMDASPTLAQMGGAIGATPGRGQAVLRAFVDGRDASSGQRVADMISDALGPRADGDAILSSLVNERRQAAGPLYEVALQTPVTATDELGAIMQTPAFKGSLRYANNIAGNEGRSLYSEHATPDGGTMIALDPSKMSLQDLHYIQRGMQDYISEVRPGMGIKDNELSRSIADVRGRLLGQMDEMSPEYQQARQIYAGSSRAMDAYRDGMNAFDSSTGENHLTPEAMERKLSGFESQAERQAYLLGARQRVSNIMGGARNNRQRAYTLFGVGNDNPNFDNQQKIAQLLANVKPAANHDAALGAIQDDLRTRLGYSVDAPDAEEITPESVHGADNPLLDHEGNLLSPDSEEGKVLIGQRIADIQAQRDADAELLAEQKRAALEFTGPDMRRGQAVADRLLSGLKAEQQFGQTRNSVSGNSETERRRLGQSLIASSEINLPHTFGGVASKAASAVANAAAGSILRRRADAVNYEIARLLSGFDTSAAASAATTDNPSAGRNPVATVMAANPLARKRRAVSDVIARALLSTAISQSNIQGEK